MARKLGPGDVSRRAPVWSALAELFLDVEPYPEDLKWIARTIADAGFTPEEGKKILREEVAPVFWWNLWSVAGEWIPWPEQQVTEMVLARLNRPPWWHYVKWLREWVLDRAIGVVGEEWSEVEAQLVPQGQPN